MNPAELSPNLGAPKLPDAVDLVVYAQLSNGQCVPLTTDGSY